MTAVAARGRLIALEGIDGCGKTTQAQLLAARLGGLYTAEPGDSELGARLRSLLLDPGSPAISSRAEALLMCADRSEHVDTVIRPALTAGQWVVTDRFSGSTLAYQGYGRGLALDSLETLVAFAADGVDPDLVIVIDVPVELGRERRRGGGPDRLEALDGEFHDRVRQGYLALAARRPDSWVTVDGRPDAGSVAGEVARAVEERLGSPPRRSAAEAEPA
jgi:dTMP kinase